VSLEMPQGTNLIRMDEVAHLVDEELRAVPEVETVSLTVGGKNGEANQSDFYVRMKPVEQRKKSMHEVKDDVRKILARFAEANPKVTDFDFTGGGMMRPFTLNILSDDTPALQAYIDRLIPALRRDERLKDLDTTFREGKKEFSFELKQDAAQVYGMNTAILGQEL